MLSLVSFDPADSPAGRARKAVFLDRDGVLIHDVHLLTQCDQVELYPFAPQVLNDLHTAGYIVVVVTNQTVVARGLASEQEVEQVHAWIQELLQKTDGAQVDRFYFCPHHPNASLPAYRVECSCRKPSPGMIHRAACDLGIDLESSWMVGDRISDIIAGSRAGCRTILVETGKHTEPPIESNDSDVNGISADFCCTDLKAAVGIILGRKIDTFHLRSP
jgi:D-glycero-D-manno-heptose 1,7-bisphosphate phosphatase